MIIAPNSTVWLCSGIPFDMGYRNTKLYSTRAAQFSDISTKAVLTVPSCTYIRNKKAIRVTCPYATAYGVNYLIFKNTSFENKYFYAFVTGCNYVNNSVFEFTYELDVIQTWMFDYQMRHCFVEREHIANDAIGASRTDEPIEYGDLVVTTQYKDVSSHNFKIGILCSFTVSTNPDGTRFYGLPAGKIVGKTYSGLSLYMFNTASEANLFLENATTDAQDKGIVSIMMYPSVFAENVTQKYIWLRPFDNTGEATGEIVNESTPFNGYVPKNKKVYQYPFRQVKVTNGRGMCAVFKWENSLTKNLQFIEFIGGYNNPEIILSPAYYNWMYANITDYYSVNAMECMTNGGALVCSWTTDSYKAWMAQNMGQIQAMSTSLQVDAYNQKRTDTRAQVNNLFKAVGQVAAGAAAGAATGAAAGAAAGGVGAAPGAIIGGVVGGITSIGSAIDSYSENEYNRSTSNMNAKDSLYARQVELMGITRDHFVMPPQATVVSTSGQLANDCGLAGFTFYCMSCRSEYAQRADQFFTMYGYAVNEIKLPNLHTRQNFNYIKTNGFQMQAALPASDAETIARAFDTGITFWHCALDSIGNYNLANGSVT